MKVDILAIGVHPDDVEMGCGGTLLKMIDRGYTVGIVDLTRGELGTRGTVETRKSESLAAAKFLGVGSRIQLGLADGFMEIHQQSLERVIQVIRHHRPNIILCNAIDDRHPDHGRASKLVSRASFLSGLTKVKTSGINDHTDQEAWRAKALYHYMQDRQLKADFVIDISQFIDKKMELIKLYKTQFYDPKSIEPNTPLTSANFLQYFRSKSYVYGRPAGFDAAEGYNVDRTIGLQVLPELDRE